MSKDTKDFLTTCALIVGALWLLRQVEDGPASVAIPIYADARILDAWPIPVFLVGMWLCFSGKHSVVGLVIMGAVAFYLFGGVA
jgi:hypothetical protein